MREVEKELGLRVVISTAVAMGTRCQIEIEREIAYIESEIASLTGSNSAVVRDAFEKRVANIRSSMERLEDSVVAFANDLRKQVAKAAPKTRQVPKQTTKRKREDN